MKARACVLLATLALSHACGVVTHTMISDRGRALYQPHTHTSYRDIVSSFPTDVYSGAPFPDYLYECGPDHDHGEDAHWAPFQAAAANYIRETYSQPFNWTRDIEGARFVAFMFGVVSHSIADVLWHGLGVPDGYGLIQTIGAFDFNGTGELRSDAHTMADTGGEFLAVRQIDTSVVSPTKWAVPADALVKVFRKLNDTVDPKDIDQCRVLFEAEAEAITNVAILVSEAETAASPMFQSEYIRLPLGGLEDMAVWTGRIWERFADWIENGPPSTLPPFRAPPRSPWWRLAKEIGKVLGIRNSDGRLRSQVINRRNNTIGLARRMGKCELMTTLMQDMARNSSALRAEFHRAGVSLNGLSRATSIACGFKQSSPKLNVTWQSLTPLATFTGDNLKRAFYGTSVAFANFAGEATTMIVGAPGVSLPDLSSAPPRQHPSAGQIYVTPLDLKGQTPTTDVLISAEDYARFGDSVAVGDFNCDGVPDLAVGAPTSGWSWAGVEQVANMSYVGAVAVFFGRSTVPHFAATPDLTLLPADTDGRGKILQFFGTVLTVADVSGDGCSDLIIGSPLASGADGRVGAQMGRVDVYVSPIAQSQSPRVSLRGSLGFERFGASIAVSASPVDSSSLLLVGSPGHRCKLCPDNARTGKVTGYRMLTNGSVQALFEVEGETVKSRCGWSVAVASDVAVVGCPSAEWHLQIEGNRTQGTVFLFETAGLTGLHSVSQLPVRSVALQSSVPSSHFGASLSVGPQPSSNHLVVGSPLHSTLTRTDSGAIWVFKDVTTRLAPPPTLVLKAEAIADYGEFGQKRGGKFGEFVSIIENKSQTVVCAAGAGENDGSGAVHFYGLPV